MITSFLNEPEYVLGYPVIIANLTETLTTMKYLHRDILNNKFSTHDTLDLITGAIRFESVFDASLYIKELHSMEHQYLNLVNGEIEKLDVYQITTKKIGKSKTVDEIISVEAKIRELEDKLSKLHQYNSK